MYHLNTPEISSIDLNKSQALAKVGVTVTFVGSRYDQTSKRWSRDLQLRFFGSSSKLLTLADGESTQIRMLNGEYFELLLLPSNMSARVRISVTCIEPSLATANLLEKAAASSSVSKLDYDDCDDFTARDSRTRHAGVSRVHYEQERTLGSAIDLAEDLWGIPDPRLIDECYG